MPWMNILSIPEDADYQKQGPYQANVMGESVKWEEDGETKCLNLTAFVPKRAGKYGNKKIVINFILLRKYSAIRIAK